EGRLHKSVGMQANAEHIGPKPGPTGHDVATQSQQRHAPLANQSAPSGVQQQSIPQYDQHRAVFLGIPPPEATPGLVGPDAAQNGAEEAEESGKADDAVNHGAEILGLITRK